MTNKKRSSNGFMYFADARRAAYEAEAKNVHLKAKELVQRTTQDWLQMGEEEREKWRNESHRRRDEYQRQVYRMQSIPIVKKPKARPPSYLELSLQPKPFPCKLTESTRKSIRQNIYQKLIWREKDNMTEMVASKKFGLVTIFPHCNLEMNGIDGSDCPPAEICTYVFTLNEGIIESERILISYDVSTNRQLYQFSRISESGLLELPQKPNHLDVHHACFRIANEMRGCWLNLILVPASQYQNLASSLIWIKQKRDVALKRDTSSVRTERLICLEDMIAVMGRIFEKDADDSSRWEGNMSSYTHFACELHRTAPTECPLVVGKSACEHFLNILGKLTKNQKCQTSDERPSKTSGDMEHCLNPFAPSVHCSRINPFKALVPYRHGSTNNEPINLIRLSSADKMAYVFRWLNSLPMPNNEFKKGDMQLKSVIAENMSK